MLKDKIKKIGWKRLTGVLMVESNLDAQKTHDTLHWNLKD